ncbi:hypothetical protein [Jannaschia seohaensis]|nr:hypothetical protein [Jannaschia seohaensis]
MADLVVPHPDAIADTISDLGAGRHEMIVDIGIYAYALSLIALAVGASHAHLGGLGWTLGIYGLILTGPIVFLVGARNEHGDGDHDGPVIQVYLVSALDLAFSVIPWAMSARGRGDPGALPLDLAGDDTRLGARRAGFLDA